MHAFVLQVDGASFARDVLQRGDIILTVNGSKVASDGSVAFRNGERILFSWLFAQLFVGDRCCLTILRRGRQLQVSYQVGKVNVGARKKIPSSQHQRATLSIAPFNYILLSPTNSSN